MEIIEPGKERRRAPGRIDPFEVIRLARQGLTAVEAAEQMGYSMWSVREVARQVGVRFADPRAFTEEEIEKARELRAQGLSYDKIAAEVGKSKAGVRKMLGRVA